MSKATSLDPNATSHQPAQKLDARIVKTLQSIRKAFFALLAKKPYDDITVQDILDEAVINRTTFYKYYNNKHELVQKLVQEIQDEVIVPMLEKRFSVTWEEFSKEFDRAWCQKKNEVIKLFWQINTPQIHIKQDIYDIVKLRYLQAHQGTKEWRASDLDFQAHLYASFLVAHIEYMIGDPKDDLDEPHVMHRNLRHLFQRILS